MPHNRLIAKLKSKKLGPKFIKVIENMYLKTRMQVRIGDQNSNSFRYERGVRQGCPTSPLLFNIYIDDLINKIDPIEVEGLPNGLRGLLFADDTVIAATSIEDLQNKLQIIKVWMDENSMAVNPSKCETMHIKALNNEISPIEIRYDVDIIPCVSTYTYLGIEFNNSLDCDLISKFRIEKGRDKLSTLTPTLRNNLIPLEYKKMLVNNIIIPGIIYGSEIFGMSEKRTSSLKKVVDQSIGQILNSKNYCRSRAYNELDLKHISIKAAMSRARGFNKWKQSKGLIKNLIMTSEAFKSKKYTWSKTIRTWLKRFKIEISENSFGREEVQNNYISRVNLRDKSEISKLADNGNIGSGKKLRRLEIDGQIESGGFNHLLKLRTGTYKFTNNLVFSGIIPQNKINNCIFCKEHGREDIKHLLLYCKA